MVKKLNSRQAAEIIGISKSQVLQACRKGTLKAKKRKLDNGDPEAFHYEIAVKDAEWYRDNRPRKGPKPRSER